MLGGHYIVGLQVWQQLAILHRFWKSAVEDDIVVHIRSEANFHTCRSVHQR
jgi:hypothetical protein